MNKYSLEIAAFTGGAVIMVLEIVGSRILSPYLGSSIYVWSSLIGVILGSLSLGYWWGGRLADKDPSPKTLANLIFLSGFLIAVTVLIKDPVLILIGLYIGDIRLGSVLAVLLLFAPASIGLATISPYVIKLKAKDLSKTGETTGNIFAISTLGSIFGTFATGFVLFSLLGSTNILLLLVFSLIIASFIISPPKALSRLKIFFLITFTIGSLISLNTVDALDDGWLEVDTRYSHATIFDLTEEETGRPIRYLVTSAEGTQSSIYLDNEYELPAKYQNYFRLVRHFNPNIKEALMLGGGAYSFANNFLYENPEANLDVVEIDEGLTELARRYFHLKDDPRLDIFHEDARKFINKTENKYDALIVDIFFSTTVPHQITTIEAIQKMYDLLNEEGVVILNMVSSADDENGKLLRSEYWTYKSVFPQIHLIAVEDPNNEDLLQNFTLVAIKSDEKPLFTSNEPNLQEYLNNLWTKEIRNDLPLLTDDFAPVEQYMLGNLKNFPNR